MNEVRWAISAGFLIVGARVLAVSLGAGDSVVLFDFKPVPTWFGFLTGGLCVFIGLVPIIALLFRGRRRARKRENEGDRHSSAA